jgi:hypothetical protein
MMVVAPWWWRTLSIVVLMMFVFGTTLSKTVGRGKVAFHFKKINGQAKQDLLTVMYPLKCLPTFGII